MRRLISCLAGLLLLAGAGSADEPVWLKKTSRVALQVSLEPERPVPGRPLVLVLEVTPDPGVHVYAPGNTSYTEPSVTLELPAGVRRGGPPVFPAAAPLVFGDLKEIVQAYGTRFRIRQPLTVERIGARRASGLRVAGTLAYQACTTKICFPPQAEPFEIAVPVPPAAPAR